MKKLLALVLVLCIFLMSFMAAAEEEYGFYADDNPEAAPYVSTWVAEDGYWRIESYDEDGGIKLRITGRIPFRPSGLKSIMRMATQSLPSTMPGCSCGMISRKTQERGWSFSKSAISLAAAG